MGNGRIGVYQLASIRKGIRAENRERLELLHRACAGPVTPAEAALALDLPHAQARRFLAYLAARGWLSRVRRGLYALVPLGASEPSEWREDPWIVAARTFAPCYIGGWTACEHWGLTEQVFRDIVIITASSTRQSRRVVQDVTFRLRHRKANQLFGTRVEWRDQTRVLVSDPSRTVVDILDEPRLGGGIRHVADVLGNYFEHQDRDDGRLVDYAARLDNRTVFKRLGYLTETLGVIAPELVASCLERMSAGLSKLDPSVETAGRIKKRWNLRVNVRVAPERK